MADTTTTKSNVLAQAPSECCAKGSIHEGTPKGVFETVTELRTYVAKPAEGKANGHVLLYFCDITGMSNNHLLLMDAWAEAGYLALGIDYFQGDSVLNHMEMPTYKPKVEGWSLPEWAMKHKGFADQAVPKWAAAVKEKYGKEGTKFASLGYCFGAPFVFETLGSGVADVGAFAHPTFLTDDHFEKLGKPLFLSCCENDAQFGNENRKKAVDILIQRKTIPWHLQLFQGVEHGFASRGDLTDPYQKWVKEQSFNGIVSFVDFWLSQG